MIRSHADYLSYLEADRIAMGRSGKPPKLLVKDPTWYYQRLLRRYEYTINCLTAPIYLPLRMWMTYRYLSVKLLLGFQIPPNVVGAGLNLVHTGDILIHDKAKIGDNLRVNVGVVIGMGAGENAVPVIGSNVVIEPGAKIFGGITIADWTHIGANAVVNKSVTEPGMIVAGVPARIIKQNPNYLGNREVEIVAVLEEQPLSMRLPNVDN